MSAPRFGIHRNPALRIQIELVVDPVRAVYVMHGHKVRVAIRNGRHDAQPSRRPNVEELVERVSAGLFR